MLIQRSRLCQKDGSVFCDGRGEGGILVFWNDCIWKWRIGDYGRIDGNIGFRTVSPRNPFKNIRSITQDNVLSLKRESNKGEQKLDIFAI